MSSKFCINCKYFGIQHPQANQEFSCEESRNEFIQDHIISHGICQRHSYTNPVTGQSVFYLALYERQTNHPDFCNSDGKFFEEIPNANN